jgi:hypothetical protein
MTVNRRNIVKPQRSMPYRQMKDRFPSAFMRNQFFRRSSSVRRLNIAGDCPPIRRGRSSNGVGRGRNPYETHRGNKG